MNNGVGRGRVETDGLALWKLVVVGLVGGRGG